MRALTFLFIIIFGSTVAAAQDNDDAQLNDDELPNDESGTDPQSVRFYVHLSPTLRIARESLSIANDGPTYLGGWPTTERGALLNGGLGLIWDNWRVGLHWGLARADFSDPASLQEYIGLRFGYQRELIGNRRIGVEIGFTAGPGVERSRWFRQATSGGCLGSLCSGSSPELNRDFHWNVTADVELAIAVRLGRFRLGPVLNGRLAIPVTSNAPIGSAWDLTAGLRIELQLP